jgi:hypothetical protein
VMKRPPWRSGRKSPHGLWRISPAGPRSGIGRDLDVINQGRYAWGMPGRPQDGPLLAEGSHSAREHHSAIIDFHPDAIGLAFGLPLQRFLDRLTAAETPSGFRYRFVKSPVKKSGTSCLGTCYLSVRAPNWPPLVPRSVREFHEA